MEADYSKIKLHSLFDPIKKIFEFFILGTIFIGQKDFQALILEQNKELRSLIEKYNKEVIPEMVKKFGYKSVMQVPKITKVVLNVGYGRFLKEPNFAEMVEKNLTRISGQKAIRTKSKKSISNFKIREGMDIGAMVTLRGPRMYYFLEKLITINFPRIRDFRGISSKSFDQKGNYNFGLKELSSFPEIIQTEIDKTHGMEITVATNAKNKEEGKLLLALLGFPFTK